MILKFGPIIQQTLQLSSNAYKHLAKHYTPKDPRPGQKVIQWLKITPRKQIFVWKLFWNLLSPFPTSSLTLSNKTHALTMTCTWTLPRASCLIAVLPKSRGNPYSSFFVTTFNSCPPSFEVLRLKRALLRTNLPQIDFLPLLLPAFDSCGAIEMIQVSQSSAKVFFSH